MMVMTLHLSELLSIDDGASTQQPDYSDVGVVTQALAPAVDAQLDRLRGLEVGWDGDRGVPPSTQAVATAAEFLGQARDAELEADRAAAIPDGGVAVYFFGAMSPDGTPSCFALMSFDNDGSATLLLEDIGSGTRCVTEEGLEGDIEDVVGRIHDHVAR